ncbi:MAG: DUF4215 domain-containing protein, partial [Spirochaetia bacterium]|nr:DUF4215 domain-containing protein [Spirochaetia bacterium]
SDYPHTNELDPQSNNYIACGNGYLDANEECDNGKENTSSCNFNCTLPVCGDALKNMAAGEECDNGLLNSDSLADACRTDCKAAYCGDNVTDTGEECDDGNTISGDGCQADCKIAVCGDGIHDIGEECDDGEFNSNTTADACRENCKNPSCGDYTVDTNEECDGGGAQSITCEAECTIPICGDSIVNMLKGEECDTGGIDTSVCDADCTLPVCGDTYVNRETAETCDDGNTITEFCVTGETSCITCDRNCIEVVREGYCGDGIIQEGEICDDGNNINGDNCSEFCNNEYIQISAGWGHTAAIKGDSTLWTWGYNARGQIGDGSTTNKYLPAQIGTSTNWAYVSAGKNQHMAAVKTNGTLWAWGWNGNGQLGDGTQVDKHSPVQVGVDTDWSIVSVGDRHTAAIKADGSLWAWGSGYLGDGTTSMRTSPVQIGTGTCTLAEYQTKMDCETNTGIWTFDTDWISVSAGSYFSIAIKIDGTLWSWGTNSWGELGLGDNTYQLLPQLVGACSVMGFYTQVDCEGNSGIWNYDTDWTLAAVGYKQAIALKSNGTLWAWGRNDYGQVGDGTSATRYLPVQIGADIDWISVSAGNNHSIAVKANKNIWAWGYNAYGQLGENTTETRFSPVLISSEVDWLKVSAGANHSIALKTDNTLWVWGAAGSGRLGIEKEFENAPKQLGASAWLAVSTGISHTVALKSDNSLWSWGNNAYGQLGDNTVIQRSLPVQVGAYFDWEKVSARYNHTAAIKADGTLWTWGANNKGQLGDGTIVDKSAPVKVGIETDWLKVSTGGAYSGRKNRGQFMGMGP